MRKLILLFVSVATVLSVQAWDGIGNPATRAFAKQFMTPEAQRENARIWRLGKKYPAEKNTAKPTDERWGKVSLDADLRSTTTNEEDIVVRIECAVEVLRNSEKHSNTEQFEALETLRRLMIELHTISRIAIEGVEHSQHDFEFTWSGNREGPSPDKRDKYETRGKLTWSKMWNSSFCGWHQGWSLNYYAYDIDLRFGRIREQAMQGTVRDWAHEVGERAKPMYEWAKPDMLLRNEPRLRLEDIHLEMVARSAYRLAAIMNSVVK